MKKLLISATILSFICSCNMMFDYKGRATDAARSWCNEMGIKTTKISCVQDDTDGDGYVSCTVKDDKDQFHALECVGSPLTLNSGCRVPKLRTPGSL